MTALDNLEWDQEDMFLVEQGYEKYMEDLFDDMMEAYETPGRDPRPTESGQFFDGCDTCIIRETMAYLVPRIVDMYVQGSIRIAGPSQDDPAKEA